MRARTLLHPSALFMVVALLLPTGAAHAAGWADLPPLSAEPAAVLAAAAEVPAPADAPVETLLEEVTWTFDTEGRGTRRFRHVYRILTTKGVEEWSSVSVTWAAWHEDRPRLEARVLTPDGKAHALDPALVSEAVDPGYAADVYRDLHMLRAPLPAVVPGAVVEVLQEVAEHRPFLAEGGVHRWLLGSVVPTRRTRVVIEAPEKLPLRWKLRGLDTEPTVTREGGVRRVVFEQGALAAQEMPESFLPGEASAWPLLEFSTAKDWRSLAAAYARTTEARLAGADVSAILARARAAAGNDREKLVAALLREVQQLRYTSIAFGESAIVPATPAETLQRGFGDCKDKALLLVALLRAAGFSADVALLRAGSSTDVDEEMPGLDLFNHAIVHVGGPKELWLDPTSPWAGVGDLPPSDQGRLALVASAGTRGLVRVPRLPASANHWIVARELDLAPHGAAQGRETFTATGWIGQVHREGWAGGTEGEGADRYFAGLAKDDWGGKAAARRKLSDPLDLAQPFTVEWAIDAAEVGWTAENDAVVDLRPSAAFSLLPDALVAERTRPRTDDFQMLPHRIDLELRIRPPEGFLVADLPPAEAWEEAGFRWETTFSTLADGRVAVHWVVDTGPARWTPAQLDALSARLRELYGRDRLSLRFVHEGARAMEEGRVGDALGAFERLAAAHPEDAYRRVQWALALRNAGLGEAARVEAEAAGALAPDDAVILGMRGRVLMHDRYGRFLVGDFDHAGAAALLRRSVELDPEAPETRANLAILLSRGTDGGLWSAGSDVDGALQVLKERREHFDARDLDGLLLAWLAHARRWDEVQALARELPSGPDRNTWLLVAAAAKGGPEGAVAEAARLGGSAEDRRSALEAASRELFTAREYTQAAALRERAAPGSPNAVGLREQARAIGAMRRHEDVVLPDDDPKSVFLAMLRSFFLGDETGLQTRMAAGMLELEDAASIGREGLAASRRADSSEMPADLVLDLFLSGMEGRVEGDAKKGWRVTYTVAALPDKALVVYVVREKGTARVRAMMEQHAELGAEAMARLAKGDEAGAKQWLGWAADARATRADDAFATYWRQAKDGADPEKLALAAAALMVEERHRAAVGLARLDAAPGGEGDAAVARARARIAGLTTLERWDEVATAAEALGALNPGSDEAFRTRAWALVKGGRVEEARALARARLAQNPDDAVALASLATAALAARDMEEGRRCLLRLEALGKATATDLNNLAWYTPRDRASLEQALRYALTASTRRNHRDDDTLHTLAVVLLDLDRPGEAREVLLTALALQTGGEELGEHWAYVRGRLAEAWGLPDAARAIYATVPEPPADGSPWSTRVLVAARRAALRSP